MDDDDRESRPIVSLTLGGRLMELKMPATLKQKHVIVSNLSLLNGRRGRVGTYTVRPVEMSRGCKTILRPALPTRRVLGNKT